VCVVLSIGALRLVEAGIPAIRARSKSGKVAESVDG
jgi:hypothetical protein